MLSDLDLGAARDYKDVFRILTERKVISTALSKRLAVMTGLRSDSKRS